MITTPKGVEFEKPTTTRLSPHHAPTTIPSKTRESAPFFAKISLPCGEVSEWLKEAASKAVVGLALPRVRIPASPPVFSTFRKISTHAYRAQPDLFHRVAGRTGTHGHRPSRADSPARFTSRHREPAPRHIQPLDRQRTAVTTTRLRGHRWTTNRSNGCRCISALFATWQKRVPRSLSHPRKHRHRTRRTPLAARRSFSGGTGRVAARRPPEGGWISARRRFLGLLMDYRIF